MLLKNKTEQNYTILFILLLFFCSIRLLLNHYLDLPLHYDEAQYWGWGQELDWGYFSKPPVLALLIRATTELCGNSENCIKSLSPIMHTITSIILFYATYTLTKNYKKAIFSAFIFLFMPGVTFSSFFISTDVPLLFFSSLVALFVIRINCSSKNTFINFLLLGVSISLGFLSKYASIYLMLSFFISIIIYKDCREFFLKKNFLITLLTTIIIILPNIIWNYNNEFVTFSHTTSNANFSDIKLSLLQGINFTLSQIFIFGLIPLFYLTKNFIYFPKLQSIQKIFLICFLFPILIVSILAVFSRANANWAVVGYPFACILLSTLLNFNRKLQINLCLSNQLLFSSFIVFLIFLSPKANYDFFSKIRHIKPLSEMIKNELSVRDNIALMADDREDYAHLVYYLRDIKVKKAKWNGDKRINDHYELTTNHEDLVGNDILLITRTKPTPAMLKKSDSFHKINSFSIPNSKKKRIFNIYLLKNWK